MAILVLDVDGVVVHGRGGRWDKDLARDLGLDPALLQSRFFAPHWKAIARGETDMMTVLESVWPEFGCAMPVRNFVDYWFARDAEIDAKVLSLVDSFRAAGGHAALGTVQEHHRARHLWETLDLKSHFDAIHYSAALGALKPDAVFYERLHAKLPATAPGDVIFLDDQPRNVEAASAFGWRAIHFRSADDLREALS
jgi:putative hydrolase of the HAD superfamily